MLAVSDIEVFNIQGALRGMRNPMNSWARSDSFGYDIGAEDLALCKLLIKAGTEHRKFLRQIFVSMDITAPLYWWKEFDTYKVGTVANSCSTMHKIHSKPFTSKDFSTEHLQMGACYVLDQTIHMLNHYREKYLETKDKAFWWQMIQLLPSSYNQKRTVTMSYENALTIIKQRDNHKLDEWRTLCMKLKDKLPYMGEFANAE